MTRKKRSDAGKPRGPRAKKTDLVPEGPATNVVQMVKPNVAERRLAEFYTRYPWVIKDTVRTPNPGDLVGLKHCHGKICGVKCVDCGAERIVNLQDAFQSQRCPKCRELASKARRAERQAARAAKRTAV